MKFLDLFAGIGGFRLGMEQAGHECIGYVEIDKFARKSYEAIHNTEGEWTAHDITRVTDQEWRQFRGRVDAICGGFPCQAFSIAGKRRGFSDTRGTLFFDLARAAKEIKPQLLLLENVKGLLNHEGGQTFRTILATLNELGYDAEWQVLNSKDFGVPQNRERAFVVGHLRGRSTRKVFPIGERGAKTNDSYITTGTLIARYPASQREGTYIEEIRKSTAKIEQVGNIMPSGNKNNSVPGRVYRTDGLSPCLRTPTGGKTTPLIFNKHRIRKLTPLECWRLQGFPDWAFDRAKEVNSDSQLYKQAGNSVTVNVICEIAKRLRV